MTAHDDLDRQLNDFLRDGPTELPYQSFDAVRDRTEITRHRVVVGPWRLPEMNKIVTFGLGAAAVVLAVLVGAQLLGPPGGGTGSGVTSSAEPTATAEPSLAEPSPSAAADLPRVVTYTPGDGVEVTMTVAAPDWEGEDILEWGERGASAPDGAGMISFAGSEYYVYGDPCAWSATIPETPATTVDEVIDALANQVSREASAPEDITVDGYAGKRIILRMAEGVDFDVCDEGFFALLGQSRGSSPDDLGRYSQDPGQIEELWVVDVDGSIVVMDGVYYPDTMPSVVEELRAILASATFDVP
jgi:hypothetical protein